MICALLAVLVWLLTPQPHELTRKGDDLHVEGRHDAALAVYRRAFSRASDLQKLALAERMVRCAREAGDELAFFTAAVELLTYDHDAWFGERNLDVARYVVEHEISFPPMPQIERPQALSATDLAITRLRLALIGPGGTPAERDWARARLVEFCRAAKTLPEETGTEAFMSMEHGERTPPLGTPMPRPAAPPDHIVLSPLQLGRNAYLAGARLEKEGKSDEALAEYRKAFELLAQNQPVYFGLVTGPGQHKPRSLQREFEVQRMLRQAAGSVARLDPEMTDRLRGGIRFHLATPELPPELGVMVHLVLERLAEPAGDSPASDEAPGPKAVGDMPFQLDRTGWIGVLDGRYRLEVKMGFADEQSNLLGPELPRPSRLFEFDLEDLPNEVEVRGQTVDLPAIKPRSLKEIGSYEPADDAIVDPAQATFRWSPIPGASYYELDMVGHVHTRGGIVRKTFTIRCAEPSFRIDQAPGAERQALLSQPAGSAAFWEVRAYDDRGLVLGRMLRRARFITPGVSVSSRS